MSINQLQKNNKKKEINQEKEELNWLCAFQMIENCVELTK